MIRGGGTGLGRAMAVAFAREGANVAVAGRRLDKLQGIAREIEQQGGQALAIPCDVTSAQDAARAVAETAARFGGLNILVNNAGTLHVSTIETIPEQEWDRVMSVNVKGPFLVSRAALAELRKAGGGAIVNIGSILGLIAAKERTAYCASKGGVAMVSKAMAPDHAPENIQVNCICPAIIETDLVRGLFDSAGGGEALRRAGSALIPMGRLEIGRAHV